MSSLQSQRMHPLDGINRPNIKITDLTVTALSYRLGSGERWPDGDNHVIVTQTTEVIVKVYTDCGIVGMGGSSRYYGPRAMMEYAEKVIKPYLLGKNPYDVERLSCGLSDRGARGVWAGIDTAFWDIIGRHEGVPLYELLAVDNEPQTRVPVYASSGEYSWDRDSGYPGPEHVIEEAVKFKAQGYKAYKFRPGAGFGKLGITMAQHEANIRKVRDAVGPDFDLIQESNGRWSLEQCLEIAPVLRELGFLWWEEPTNKRGDHAIDEYLRIKESVAPVMLSGGETRANRGELSEWVDRGAYDIVQHGADDAGMTEAWHMARMAGERGKRLCTHNWQGGLVTLANAHLMAASPNRFLLESNMTANPLKEGLFTKSFAVENGYITLPAAPGLGLELRPGLEEEFPFIDEHWFQ